MEQILTVVDKHSQSMPDQAYREIADAIQKAVVEKDRLEIVQTVCTFLVPKIRSNCQHDDDDRPDDIKLWVDFEENQVVIPMTKADYDKRAYELQKNGHYDFLRETEECEIISGLSVFKSKRGTLIRMRLWEQSDLNWYY